MQQQQNRIDERAKIQAQLDAIDKANQQTNGPRTDPRFRAALEKKRREIDDQLKEQAPLIRKTLLDLINYYEAEKNEKGDVTKFSEAGWRERINEWEGRGLTGPIIDPVDLLSGYAAVKSLPTLARCAVSQGTTAILRDGFYEVNGFKFSSYYYTKLWSSGRGAPSLIAREILATGVKGIPDAVKPGFFRYVAHGWEMIYNPVTKEVWHLQPIK